MDERQDEDAPSTLRSWHAYDGEGPTEFVPHSDPPSEGAAPSDDERLVEWKLRHRYIAKEVSWFAAVPWDLCERAFRTFAGSLPQLLREAISFAANSVRGSIDDPGLDCTSQRLFGTAERRDFVVLKIDPNDFELVASYLHNWVDGGRAGPTASRVVIWALAHWCAEKNGDVVAARLLREPEPERPRVPLWVPTPLPPDALPREAVRKELSEILDRLEAR